MQPVHIVGIGPGSADLITPRALGILNKSDLILGGKRNLNSLEKAMDGFRGKKTIGITADLAELVTIIKENREKTISVAASGDPGFYSILRFFKKHFMHDELDIIPGISSVQYMFARLGFSYEEAYTGSLHGRDSNISRIVGQYGLCAFLTDSKNTPASIAKTLMEDGVKQKKIYVGNNLSCSDEEILSFSLEQMAENRLDFPLCVVVIKDDRL